MIKRLASSLFLCTLLCACSGGGGSTLPATQPTAASPSSNASHTASVTVSIAIPGAPKIGSAVSRQPRYISVNTNSVTIAINGGTPVVANLAANSPNCTGTGSGRTCSITVNAPIGTDTFAEAMYQSTDGSGAALSASTTSATIVAGKANVVTMTLDGIVASIALTLSNPTPPVGTAAKIPLTVNFYDASGAAIIGSDAFANPITLSDSDTSGQTSLSTTQLPSPSSAAAVTVNYTGTGTAPAVLSATAAGVAAARISPATLTPVAAGTVNFVDWPTYGYDSQRSGYNPSSTGITPSSIGQIKVGWGPVSSIGETQSQPIIATNVAGHQALVIIGNFNGLAAYDGLTGQLVWSDKLQNQTVQSCGSGPVAGTPYFDRALGAVFIAGGNGSSPNHVVVYRVDVATGQPQSGVAASVDATPQVLTGEAIFGHTALTFANGLLYLGVGSSCEGTNNVNDVASWRGRVIAIDPGSMTLVNTFYPTYGQNGNYGGGGVWPWGGVSADANGNVYAGTGNAETADTVGKALTGPFVLAPSEQQGYAEHLVKLNANLSAVEDSNYPGFNFSIGGSDLDYAGTPVVFSPTIGSGCGSATYTATMGKDGVLFVNNAANLSAGPVNSFALSVPSSTADFVGNPAYSPATGMLYAPIASSGQGSLMLPPGMAAISGCGSNAMIQWNTAFGVDSTTFPGPAPRSAPSVTAGGVVFMATPETGGGGAVWALNAQTGALLNGGAPVLTTADKVLMAPTTDGLWIYVLDNSGNLYGLSVDPSVHAAAVKRGRRVTPSYVIRSAPGH